MDFQKINIVALRQTANEQGISACKLVVETIISAIRSARDIFADGKVKFLEWLQLIELGSDIAKVANQWAQFLGELNNLGMDELDELCSFTAAQLDLESDAAYIFITKYLPDLINGILVIVRVVIK